MPKTIHDPLHGSIRVDDVFLEMLDRPEMQRLRYVKQLGMGNLVFPGANHSRFEHSLGVFHLAGRMADAIGLSETDTMAVKAAGMLHDICHAPFSHTLEGIMEDRTGLDHMDLARKLIKGEVRTFKESDEDLFGGCEPISEILESNGISADAVCDMIAYPVSLDKGVFDFSENKCSHFPSRDYVHQIIHGPVDADQMDYLMRDARYTGVALGDIDADRILNTMRIHNDRIVIESGGIPAAEGLMVSRSLMYTSVYFHQTVRMINGMLSKAAEISGTDLGDMYLWNDMDLTAILAAEGGRSSRLMRSLQNRIIYKKAFVKSSEDTSDELSVFLSHYSSYRKTRELEQEIADRAGVDFADVVVDMPSESVLLSKINIGKTDVSILEGEKVRSLARISPIAKALQSRNPFGRSVIVGAPKEHRDAVEKAANKIFSL